MCLHFSGKWFILFKRTKVFSSAGESAFFLYRGRKWNFMERIRTLTVHRDIGKWQLFRMAAGNQKERMEDL